MEYKNSDILLYSVKNNKIVVIYNDKEKMEKYLNTGDLGYAPVKVFVYSKDLEYEFSSQMKKIKKYETNSDSTIKVLYTDGTEYTFANSNLETIKSVKTAQDNLTKKKPIGDFAALSEEEKTKRRKKLSENGRRGLAGALAAIMLTGGIHHGGKLIKNTSANMSDATKPGVEDTFEPTATPTPTPTATPIAENIISNEELQKYADQLYTDITTGNSTLLNLQQITGVLIDKELSYSIVELINGIYPTRLLDMDDKQSNEEMKNIREAIELIHASNFNNTNSAESMINLSKYIKNKQDSALVNNALYVAREVVSESVGEPLEGKILEDYQTVNVFSREYNNAVDQLLNYEWETMNSTEFLQAPTGVKSVVTSIWFQIAAQIPTWSHVTRESSEFEPREHELYFNYFYDQNTTASYLPRPNPVSGKSDYVYTDEYCHEEIYTEAEMYALAGLPYEARDVERHLEENPNILQMGLYTEMRNRMNEQDDILYNGKENLSSFANIYSDTAIVENKAEPETKEEMAIVENNTESEKENLKKDNKKEVIALSAAGAAGVLAISGLLKKKEEEEEVYKKR